MLGIGQTDGAMAQVLASTKAGETADWNEADIMRAFLAAAYKQFCETGVPETSGDIGPYTRRATARALARLLESV